MGIHLVSGLGQSERPVQADAFGRPVLKFLDIIHLHRCAKQQFEPWQIGDGSNAIRKLADRGRIKANLQHIENIRR